MKQHHLLAVISGTALICTLCACQSYVKPPMAISHSIYSEIPEEEKIIFPVEVKQLSLEEAQRIALKNNPDFLSVQFSIDSARARYYQSFSGYAPTLNVGMSLSQSFSKTFMAKNTTRTRSQSENYRPSLSGNWLIFDSLQREMNLISARYSLKQAEDAREDAKRLLLRAVAYAYNDIQLAATQKRIAEAQITYAQQMLEETQRKYDAGTALLTDVLNFRTTLRNAELDLNRSEYSIRSDKYVLAGYLGITDGTIPDDVTFPKIEITKAEPLADVNVYLDQALANRPDLRQVRNNLESAKYSFYASLAKFGPSVSANYSLGYGVAHNVPKRGGNTWTGTGSFSYGLSADWNLFNGFADYFSAKSSYAQLASVDYTLAQTFLNIIQEVRTAYDNYKNYSEQQEITAEILDMTQQTRDLVRSQYNAGTALITRLNEAERDLVNAQHNLASAVINTYNAKAQLEAAVYAIREAEPSDFDTTPKFVAPTTEPTDFDTHQEAVTPTVDLPIVKKITEK